MKKEYTKPQMEVVEMTASLLVSNSKVGQVNSGGVFGGLGGGSNSGGRSREDDDWDE